MYVSIIFLIITLFSISNHGKKLDENKRLIKGRKSGAKLLQKIELCKFFGKKSFQQFSKVFQNKKATRSK